MKKSGDLVRQYGPNGMKSGGTWYGFVCRVGPKTFSVLWMYGGLTRYRHAECAGIDVVDVAVEKADAEVRLNWYGIERERP